MIINYIKITVLLCLFFINISATDILILDDSIDTTDFNKKLIKDCSFHNSSISKIKYKKNIISEINREKPAVVIFRSENIKKMVEDISSTIDLNIPFIIVTENIDNNDKKNIYINPSISVSSAINGFAQYTNKNINSIGYIYSKFSKNHIKNEIDILKQDGITSVEKEVDKNINIDGLVYSINKLTSNNISIFRFLEVGPILDIIDTSDYVSKYLEKRSAAIISNSSIFSNKIYSKTPIISIRENIELTAAGTAYIAILRSRLGKNIKTNIYNINSTVASVKIGSLKHFTITNSQNNIVNFLSEEIDSLSIKNPDGWSDLKIFPFIEPVYKKNIKIDNSVNFSLLDKIIISKYFNLIIIAIISVILFIIILFIIMKYKRRIKQKRRSLVCFPTEIKYTEIFNGENSDLLSKITHNEKINIIGIDNLKNLQKQIRKFIPNIFIIDWNTGRESINFIKNELENYPLSSVETILVFNVPNSLKHSEKFKFKSSNIITFEKTPDEFDLIDIYRGRYNNTDKDSEFISGSIDDETLPTVLQLLDSGKKNGALIIEDSSPLSVIYYKNGKIIFAEDRFGNHGESAIYNGLNVEKGFYSFMLNRTSPSEIFSLDAMGVLLEFASLKDNANRG